MMTHAPALENRDDDPPLTGAALTAEIEHRVAAIRLAAVPPPGDEPIVPAGMSYARALQIAIAALDEPFWHPIDAFEDLGHLYQVRRRAPRG